MMKDVTNYSHYKEAVIGAVTDLAAEHDDIVFLDADLSSCIGSTSFQKAFPDRFFNCGIAEANMAAVAGGLSSVGLTPFIHSFGCFASRRMYDQLFLSVGYAHRVVHVIGSDPGITAQYNGGTHMPFEDIALMRQIPGMVIVEPSDGMSLYELTKQIYYSGKMSYTRTPRKGITFRYKAEDTITLGKGVELLDGKDCAIVATGALMVDTALAAAKNLKEKGVDVSVVDLHTIRPLDIELIDRLVERCGRMVVCENGRYAGGVGEMIAAHVVRTAPCKMDFMCVGERFGEVGNLKYLAPAFGFTAENLEEKVLGLLK